MIVLIILPQVQKAIFIPREIIMCIHKHNYVLVFQVRDSSPAASLHRGGESRGSRGTLPKVGSVTRSRPL
jgi:hypothetical protein